MDDSSLLKRYISESDEKAFREIVDRYYPLVHRVAYTKTEDYALADDVASAVFMLLASRARSFGPKIVLAGWLFRASHLSACNAIRIRRRRLKREAEAAARAEEEMKNDWARLDIESLSRIDDALLKLSERERNAVLLRYSQGLSITETALALGISPEAAQRRASRGLERLRSFCARHGSALGVGAISSLLAVKTAHAAPESIVSISLCRASHLTSNSLIHQIYQGALRQMSIIKMKTAACYIFGVVAVFSGAGYAVSQTARFQKMTERPKQNVLISGPVSFGDITITYKGIVTGRNLKDQNSASTGPWGVGRHAMTVYFSGSKMKEVIDDDYILIFDIKSKTEVTLLPKSKTYTEYKLISTPLNKQVILNVQDTGKKKEFFGYSAHLLKFLYMQSGSPMDKSLQASGYEWVCGEIKTCDPFKPYFIPTWIQRYPKQGLGVKVYEEYSGAQYNQGTQVFSYEATSISTAPIPTSTFEIPAGYIKKTTP